ncbi:MAG: glycerophosphodiester phosphodiesterase family protein [Pseudomonadota bacterium]
MSRQPPDASWIARTPITHRGFHDLNQQVWENTPSAFARAIEAGFAIECDLQLAGDDVPLVFHDYETDRLCGVSGTVREMGSQAVTQLAVGGTNDHVPTFADFLGQVDGQVGLVIELKAPREDHNVIFAEAVLADLEGYQGQACLMSFDSGLVGELLDRRPQWPVGLVAAEFNDAERQKNREAQKLPLDFLSFCVDHLPSAFVSDMRARGLPVITWTVRDEAGRMATAQFADQMTFEGFDPRLLSA